MSQPDTRVGEVVWSPKEFKSDFYGVQLGMVVVSNCAFIVSQILWLQSLLLLTWTIFVKYRNIKYLEICDRPMLTKFTTVYIGAVVSPHSTVHASYLSSSNLKTASKRNKWSNVTPARNK